MLSISEKQFLPLFQHGKISIPSVLIPSVLLRQSSGKKEFCEFMAAFCYSLLICKSEEFNTGISGKILHSPPLSLRSLRMKLQVKFP